jgi:hypothetical protein
MFPTSGLVMRFSPGELKDIGEETLCESVTPDNALGKRLAVRSEFNRGRGLYKALRLKSPHHFAHSGSAHVKAFCNARLNDVNSIFTQFEDAVAILLERRMMFAGDRHACDPTSVY